MSNNHVKTIVPIEAWLYHSPKLKLNNINYDMGLVCEALVYYDKIFISIDNRDHFNAVILWFKKQNAFSKLLELMNEEIINFVFHSFMTYPIYDPKNDAYSIWNLNDNESKNENVFNKRILYNSDLNNITKTRERTKLFRAIENNVVELKADEFGSAIDNARSDASNPEKSNILIQSFIDDLYRQFNLDKPIKVRSVIMRSSDKSTISWNVNFDDLNKKTNNKLGIHKGIPLAGIAQSNKLIKTSSILKADLYLGSVMNSLVNNKLAEINSTNTKINSVVKELNVKVAFPKISDLVNNNILKFEDIMYIRKNAKKFRGWLQQEGDHDRDAIIAYHNEVAEKTKLTKFGFGLLSITGSIIGGAIGSVVVGPIGGALGGATGYMADKFILSFNEEWKPMVFGNWVTKYIEDIN